MSAAGPGKTPNLDTLIQKTREKTIAERLELKNGKPRFGTTRYGHQGTNEEDVTVIGSFEKGTNEVIEYFK